MAPTEDALNSTGHSSSSTSKKKKKKKAPQASMGDTMKFVFDCGPRIKILFALGCVGGVANGLVYPILAYMFSSSFTDISASSSEGLAQVRELAYTFMVIGTYALVAATVQTYCFEICAHHGAHRFRVEWFRALLRAEPAYFDVHNVGGIAQQIGPNANKFRRGLGRKFGEGIQFLTTGVGGLGFAFYSSWRVALVVLSVVPLVSAAAFMVVTLNQTKGARSSKAYKKAGGVAYSSVSSIRTVLSLNAASEMIRQYCEATQEAYEMAAGMLYKQGFFNGAMLAAFLMLYAILTLYGTSLLYRDLGDNGCDPSAGVAGNETCENSGPELFGAMLGVAFASQGISQFGNFGEAFTQARVAVFEALKTINRQPGAPEEVIYKKPGEDDKLGSTVRSGRDNLGSTVRSAKSKATDDEQEQVVKAILPKYEIDSSSTSGAKPEHIRGDISLKNVHFAYPTRPQETVLKGLSVDIPAGAVCAFVGQSGSGKSTTVQLLERFYDPSEGTITLDGINLRDINVSHLRGSIGYVGQEPTLFATTIRGNIQYGNPDATEEQIIEAAKMANAHDFITSFSDGYDTQVGDKGGQLSGGQKQRIAIARVLVGKPRILLLDEATSALDAESELVVQDALDNILQQHKITTIIIAHRLSTIRGADMINVVHQGSIVESGTHEELMERGEYYYRLVQKQESNKDDADSAPESGPSSRNNSATNLAKLDMSSHGDVPHLEFHDVVFAYPTRPKKIVFNHFNLKIPQGMTLALVGPSGGGKSTTVGLIERFYDPTEGSVEFMGVDIQSLNVHWYRDQIGYVGQEPQLFDATIGRNIAYGWPGASQASIETAAKQANAHDFIMEFPEGYDTPIGNQGIQLSGGQKQRVAIARALVKNPSVLILDEATSALDNESEAIVQEAIDQLMQSRQQTVIVIAHRLSTIRNADKIAFIGNGKVLEFGSHDELMANPDGRYFRLFESSRRSATISDLNERKKKHGDGKKNEDEAEEEIDWEAKIKEEEEKALDAKRARSMAAPDVGYMLLGAIGAILAGAVFPLWGVLFSETMDLLFRRVEVCPSEDGSLPGSFGTCEAYWDSIADDLRESSFAVSGYWLCVMVGCLVGNVLVFYGFGTASERLSKRVRDSTFEALLRQEVAFFDKRSVGSITSQLQDDAARIQAFSGEPVRSFLVAMSSVLIGLTLSFIFMWPFALLAIGCIPMMGFATSMEMKQLLGEDEGDTEGAEGLNTPGGVIVETLLNIRTVSALTLENRRFDDYENALNKAEPNVKTEAFTGGLASGLSMFVQQWVNALQLWFGGYLLFTFPEDYEFRDFLISNFAVLFALFGLGSAFQDISDRKEVEKSAGRIFYLLDRKSAIDPMSPDGEKLGDDKSAVIKGKDEEEGSSHKVVGADNEEWKTKIPLSPSGVSDISA